MSDFNIFHVMVMSSVLKAEIGVELWGKKKKKLKYMH